MPLLVIRGANVGEGEEFDRTEALAALYPGLVWEQPKDLAARARDR